MAKINIVYDEMELRKLILKDLSEKMPGESFDAKQISIQVKSKQNYKSEWESAAFQAVIDKYY